MKRDFNGFAKFCLVLSMLSVIVDTIGAIQKLSMIDLYYNLEEDTLIFAIVLNSLIIIAAIFTFLRKSIALAALTLLFIIKFISFLPDGSILYSYMFGKKLVILFRDFGLFAIAMCFKKNGVSGWKSMLGRIPEPDDDNEVLSEESSEINDTDWPDIHLQEAPEDIDKSVLNDVVKVDNDIITEKTQIEEVQDCNTEIQSENIQERKSKKNIVKKKWWKIILWTLCGLICVAILTLACIFFIENGIAKKELSMARTSYDRGLYVKSLDYAQSAGWYWSTSKVKVQIFTLYAELDDVIFEYLDQKDKDSYYKDEKYELKTIYNQIDDYLNRNKDDVYVMQILVTLLHNHDYMVDETVSYCQDILLIEDNPQAILIMNRYLYEWIEKRKNNELQDHYIKELERWSKKGIEIDSLEGEHYYMNAYALYKQEKKTEAKEIYETASSIDSEHPLRKKLEYIVKQRKYTVIDENGEKVLLNADKVDADLDNFVNGISTAPASHRIRVTGKNGNNGTIPVHQLKKALSLGYKLYADTISTDTPESKP